MLVKLSYGVLPKSLIILLRNYEIMLCEIFFNRNFVNDPVLLQNYGLVPMILLTFILCFIRGF